MAWKNKQNGKFYDVCRYSCVEDEETTVFKCWDKTIPEKITVKTLTNDKLIIGSSEKHKEAIMEIFDNVPLQPIFETTDVEKKYKKIIIDIKCPLCGSTLEWDGSVLLSYPSQYRHACPKCDYHTTLHHFYQGQVVYCTSDEEAYRIITKGTWEEKNQLADRKI